jgi:hypothetical protein
VDARSNAQVGFVIGHEIGKQAAGHFNRRMLAVRLPGYVVPSPAGLFAVARNQLRQHIGACLSKDFDASRSALQIVGLRLPAVEPGDELRGVHCAGSHGAVDLRLHRRDIPQPPPTDAPRREHQELREPRPEIGMVLLFSRPTFVEAEGRSAQ